MKRPLITVLAIVFALIPGVGAAFQVSAKAPEVVILKSDVMGGVKFNHPAHVKVTEDKCETCHHASKPEKPYSARTKTAGIATPVPWRHDENYLRAAFHDGPAKREPAWMPYQRSGGKKPVPLKCADCTKRPERE